MLNFVKALTKIRTYLNISHKTMTQEEISTFLKVFLQIIEKTMHCLNRYICKEKELIRKKMTVPKSSYHLDNYQYIVEKPSKKVPHIVEDGSDYIDDDSSDCSCSILTNNKVQINPYEDITFRPPARPSKNNNPPPVPPKDYSYQNPEKKYNKYQSARKSSAKYTQQEKNIRYKDDYRAAKLKNVEEDQMHLAKYLNDIAKLQSKRNEKNKKKISGTKMITEQKQVEIISQKVLPENNSLEDREKTNKKNDDSNKTKSESLTEEIKSSCSKVSIVTKNDSQSSSNTEDLKKDSYKTRDITLGDKTQIKNKSIEDKK